MLCYSLLKAEGCEWIVCNSFGRTQLLNAKEENYFSYCF